jgi:hypothetical protein
VDLMVLLPCRVPSCSGNDKGTKEGTKGVSPGSNYIDHIETTPSIPQFSKVCIL